MTGSRDSEPRAGGSRATTFPAGAAPHGYDHAEFAPGESRRDFPPRRPRGVRGVPDEERRMLQEAQAAFEGPDRRHDANAGAGRWDRDGGEHLGAAPPDGAPSPRLYRE